MESKRGDAPLILSGHFERFEGGPGNQQYDDEYRKAVETETVIVRRKM